MKNLVKTVIFCMVGMLLLGKTEDILSLKMNSLGSLEDFNRTFQQFYQLERNSLQAVFLGKSTIKWAVSPIQIYKDSNIATYNLATNKQPIQASYYLLKEVFKNQSPEIVFCHISALFENTEEDPAWHIVMDNTPMSRNKVSEAISLAGRKANGKDLRSLSKSFMSIMSPLYFYHNRWDGLVHSDFCKPANPDFDYAAGYYMTSAVTGTGLTVENVNSEVRALEDSKGFKQEYCSGIYEEYEITDRLYQITPNRDAIEYMTKMKELCKMHNAQLVMTKIPTIGMPQIYYASWSYDKYEMAKKVCDEIGVAFLDMVYDETYRVEIDWKKDVIDGGQHFNIRGTEKITECIAMYCEQLGLEKQINEYYWQCAEEYDKVKRICMLQSEFDFSKYINRLMENDDYTVIIAAQNDFQASLTEEIIQSMRHLGLQSCYDDGVRNSYIGIMDHKEIVYEVISNRKSEYANSLPGGGKIEVISSGLNTGANASIKINGKEYSTNLCGLNFVVFDNSTNLVIDSVNFNTSVPGATGYRNKTVISDYLCQYKRAVVSDVTKDMK